MAADEQLRVEVIVDPSQLTAGMVQASATVRSAADQMAQALSEVSPASVKMAASLKQAGMSATEANSALKNLGFTSKETSEALTQVGLALNETAPAADRAAVGVNNARAAMMGLNRELGLGGNRALSTFIAQSETIGPLLSSAFTGIAVAGFIQLASLAGEKLSKLISDTFIFTQAEKDSAAQIEKDNKTIQAAYDKHIASLREISLIGLSREAADALRLKYAQQDRAYAQGLVDSLTKQVAAETQKLDVIQKQADAQKKAFSYTGPGAAPQLDLGPKLKEQQALVDSLNSTLGVLQTKVRATGDAVQEAGKKFTTQALKDHEKELERAAKSNEEFTAKMQHLTSERERFALAEKKVIEDSAEFRRKVGAKEVEQAAKGAEQIAEAERKFQADRLKDAEELSIAKIRSEENAIQEQLRLGLISGEEARVQLNKLVRDKLAIELSYIKERETLILERLKTDDAKAYAEDAAEWSKLLHEKQQTQITANAAIQANNEKTAIAGAKPWQTMFHSIQSGMDQAIRGVLTGTEGFGKAFSRTLDDMTAKFIAAMAMQAMQYIAAHVLMLSVHKSIHQQEVLADAKSAAAAAWKAVAGIPVIGPILAPIAATTAFAGVEAFSAEGGMNIVPADNTVAILHKNEKVLTAGEASLVRNFVGSGSQGGGEITINYAPTVNAIDSRGMKEALAGHGDTIVKLIQQHQREFRI